MNNNPSLLGSLRQVTPHRVVTFEEALRVAELQASKLLAVLEEESALSWEHLLGAQPRLHVVYEDLPVSGTSHWNGQHWVIALNRHDALTRQRFTLLHEFKHIVDHGQVGHLYEGDRRRTSREQAELAADYFAGCALVPKRLLKSAWGQGMQRPEVLADHFGVSIAAVEVRLSQTGLSRSVDREPAPRCARPVRTRLARQQFAVVRSRRERRSYL